MRYSIRHFKTLASTNDKALALARRGAPEGLVITADYQTRGRGRGTNRWISPRGANLLFSLLVRPEIRSSQAPLLTQVAARAVRDVLAREYPETELRIKKPNDVLMNGKKISGILVESSSQSGRIDYAVVGIGVNICAKMSYRIKGSTSIYEEISRKIDKNHIFKAILLEFKLNYLEFFKKRELSYSNEN